jgi:hypothetical protein
VHDGDLLTVLGSIPFQDGGGVMPPGPSVRCEAVVEDAGGDRELVDQVRTFDSIARSYGRRRVRHHYLVVPNPTQAAGTGASEHDPMTLLEES